MTEMVSIDENLSSLAEANDLISDMEGTGNKFLTFKVAGELFGTEIDNVNEIIEYSEMTRVPLTPPHIKGVSNLRGNVVPVIDLAVRLGKEPGETTKRTCIIIVEMDDDGEKMDIGFIVDEVDEVLDIHADTIEPAPQFGADIRSEYINGMGKLNGQFVILLLLHEVLSIKELSQLVLDEPAVKN
ncbi:MAG: chemotaxis protein CheW [Gammaproteobacteria bacterium]|nr:MAG: chemotaxis protein CheW [Gammaproteobacteria bacterium]